MIGSFHKWKISVQILKLPLPSNNSVTQVQIKRPCSRKAAAAYFFWLSDHRNGFLNNYFATLFLDTPLLFVYVSIFSSSKSVISTSMFISLFSFHLSIFSSSNIVLIVWLHIVHLHDMESVSMFSSLFSSMYYMTNITFVQMTLQYIEAVYCPSPCSCSPPCSSPYILL